MRMRGSGNDASTKDCESDVESVNCCQLNVHKARIREYRSRYHNHPEKRFFHRRSCTDLICLLAFVGCLTGWIYLGFVAMRSTSPEALLAPRDSRNRRCGFDPGVRDRPYVFYFDLLKCVPPRASVLDCDSPRVCISECPKENFYLRAFLDTTSINVVRSKLICQDGFNKGLVHDEATAYSAVRSNSCAEWYLESKPIFRRCLHNSFEMYNPPHIETHINESARNDTGLSDAHVMSDLLLSYVLCLLTTRGGVHKVRGVAPPCRLAVVAPLLLRRGACSERLLLLVGNRCLPKSLTNTADEVRFGFESLGRKIESTISGVTGKEVLDASKAMADIFEFGHAVFQDLSMVWPWLLVLVCVAGLVSFVYITIMRWVSGLMVWLSVFASIALLLFSSYFTFAKFKEFAEYESMEAKRAPLEEFGPLELLWKKETWLAFFIISVAFLIVILVTIVFLRSRIVLAIELIKEGSKAVISSWSAVVFPVFPWAIQLAVVAYGVVIFAYLINSGIPIKTVVGLNASADCVCKNSYQEGSACEEKVFNTQCYSLSTKGPCVTAKCVYSEEGTQKQAVFLHLYNALMFLWSLFFASGFGQMVLASTFATYYWTFNKDDLPMFMVAGGVARVMRYHLGTVALGSFLLALCNWIRILIEVCYNRLNKYDNGLVKLIKCCCSCVFWCLNNFLKFLNKNAYIMCAIHGKSFCTSAKLAFNLLVRNILKVAILDRVTNFLFFLGKVMVTAAMGLLSFYFFSKPVPPIQDPLKGDPYTVEYYFVPIVIVCIVTYFISSLFFGVYSMAVDTLFLCALEDLETNDGSPEKPYFMSKNLMKILKRRNEIKVN